MSSKPANIDKEIMLQVSQGNEQAFALLFNQYREPIYRTAYRLTDSASTAEDLLQEVFLIIWLNRQSLPGIENFHAYLMTIARNHIIQAFKRLARLQSSITELSHLRNLYHNDTAHLLQENEYNRVLQQAIAQLPPRQAQVYLLTREHGFSREQVAQQLNVYPETVKSHMEIALRKIRAYCLAKLVTYIAWIPVLLSC